MTNAVISVAKYENERHMMWHTAQASFKSSLIRSLGPSLEGAICPPPDGFQMISAKDIMDNVKIRYGKVDQMTFVRMEEVLATPLDHVQNLEKHVATQKRHMLMQTSIEYPLEEYRKVLIFRKSVTMHPQIRECLGDYDKKFEDPLLHTYDAIVEYVSTHLPNIRAAAGLSSSAMTGKAFQVSLNAGESSSTTPLNMTMDELQCAYSVLEYKHKALQTSRQKRPGNGKGKNAKKAKGNAPDPDKPVTKDDCKFYCHGHGYQNSHNSAQCKVMANQPQNFTANMRRARNPNNSPGGSTAVRGRQPTVQATGFMVTDHDDLSAHPPRLLRRTHHRFRLPRTMCRPWCLGRHGCWKATAVPTNGPTTTGVVPVTPSSGPRPRRAPSRPLLVQRLRLLRQKCLSSMKNTYRDAVFPPQQVWTQNHPDPLGSQSERTRPFANERDRTDCRNAFGASRQHCGYA
jgi:hypothetical protein